jgi:ABC-2 type transport system permease protein
MQFLETMDHEFYDYHYGRLYDSYLEQRRLQDQFGVIAPVLPLSSLSMGLSGVDLMHHRVFTTAAEDQRRRMVTEMNTYLSEMAVEYNNNLVNMQNVSMETNDRVLIAPEEIFRRVPAFHYEPPGLAAVMTEYRGAFIVLAGWLLAAIGASFAALTRLRPQMR